MRAVAAAMNSWGCSTPFGITDYIGRILARESGAIQVLNAFRHHGLYRSVMEVS